MRGLVRAEVNQVIESRGAARPSLRCSLVLMYLPKSQHQDHFTDFPSSSATPHWPDKLQSLRDAALK